MSALRNAFDLALDEAAQSLSATARIEARLVRPALRALVNRGLEAFATQLSERGLALPHG